MAEPDGVYYLKSILGQLRQVKDGVAFSRYRSLLGVQVLADNIDWLDCHIDQLERAHALQCAPAKPVDGPDATSGSQVADNYNGTSAYPDEN